MWQDSPYEVTAESEVASGCRWTLQMWPDGEAMRTVCRLDSDWVESLAADEVERRRASTLRKWSIPVAPLLAVVPAAIQRKWQSEWGFPAILASQISALIELGAGAAGLTQSLALAFQGDWFLPGPLRFLAFVGPFAMAEGLVRLNVAFGHGEPIGSLVGLPAALLQKRESKGPSVSVPTVHRLDDDGGCLELSSEIQRRDWVGEGVLMYRGHTYRVSACERLGVRWLYRFERVSDVEGMPRLRLWTELKSVPPVDRPTPPSVLRTTLVTALICLAPRVFQERWGRHLKVRPAWFTLLGAGAELLGGWVNLGQSSTVGGSWLFVLNLFILVEGVARIALLASSGRPVGSILGWLARPLLDRLVPREG
jgi:hypothetical protein